jgi:hypothetical protein
MFSRISQKLIHPKDLQGPYSVAIFMMTVLYGYYSNKTEFKVQSEPFNQAMDQTKVDKITNKRNMASEAEWIHQPVSQPFNVSRLRRMRSLPATSLSDKYLVDWTQTLGEGAYGSVHPARLASTGEKVALKKMSKRYTNTSSFRNETDALMRIYNNGGHPNISGLRDMFEDQDYYYLVMDLVSGGEMFDHLIQYGAYSEADAARLM